MRKISNIFDKRVPFDDYDRFDLPSTILKESDGSDLSGIAERQIFIDKDDNLLFRRGGQIKILSSKETVVEHKTVSGGGGSSTMGDMLKLDYDTDEDGIVDAAESVDDGIHSTTAQEVREHINNVSNPHGVDKADVGLDNVTNDAQLKRSANDFSSFGQKTTLATTDKILIEDSAEGGNKKYVEINDLPSGGGSATVPDDLWLILAKESLDNLEIRAASLLASAAKKNIIEDIFSDTTGYNDTVDTVNTDASFVTNKYTNEGGYTVDVTSMTFQGIGDSVALQESALSGCSIKPDGTKLYTIGSGSDGINQYSVVTPFDMTTLAHDKYFSTAAQEITPRSLFFKPDGTKLYIVGAGSTVYEYDLSIPWDMGTATYNSNSFNHGLSINDIKFSSDGTKMYLRYINGNTIREYSLSSAWDVSTASYTDDFDFSTEDSNMASFVFDSTGTILIGIGRTGSKFFQYSLSTAWDVTTISYSSLSYDYTTDLGSAIPNSLSFAGDDSVLVVSLNDETMTAYTFVGSSGGDVVVVTEAQTLSFTPTKFMIVTWRESLEGTGSINFDISFNGGTNEQTGINANTVTTITNSGTSLILTINLLEGVSNGTAELQGYAVIFW